jgi:hypothetical protein
VSPHRFVVAFAAFSEAAANCVAEQLKHRNALLDTTALPLGENALFLRRRVGFANAVAASRLDLAGEPADVALELHQLGIMIFNGLFEAVAAQLPPFDFGGIRCCLLDGGKRCGLGLLLRFAACDLGDYGSIPSRTIGIGTERKSFGDALADHLELGFDFGLTRHRLAPERRSGHDAALGRSGWVPKSAFEIAAVLRWTAGHQRSGKSGVRIAGDENSSSITSFLWRRTLAAFSKFRAQRNLSLDLGDQGWTEPLSARRELKTRKQPATGYSQWPGGSLETPEGLSYPPCHSCSAGPCRSPYFQRQRA